MVDFQGNLQELIKFVHSLDWETIKTLRPEILFSAIVTILLLLLGSTYLFAKARGEKFLLIGPSGAGKTALFVKLTKGLTGEKACHGTVTSMQKNEGDFKIPTRGPTVRMVDMPGHPRLHAKVEQEIFDAAALIFMIDSTEFMPKVRDIATFLYELLANPWVQKHKMGILIACNKMDLTAAHSTDFIAKRLEKELETMRKTVLSMMADTKGEGERYSQMLVGKKGEPFSFSQCKNVSFASVSVSAEKLSGVEDFIKANL